MKNLLRVLGALFVVVALAGVVHATVWTMPTLPPVGNTNTVSQTQGSQNYGGNMITGSVVVSAIGTPSAPTLTTNGTAGSTSLVYACTGVDLNGNATIPSATTTIATANATLSTTNSVNIICPGKTGAMAFLIHKADTSHVLGICYTYSGVSCLFKDDGSVATTFTYTPNTVDQTGNITGPNTLQAKTVTVRAAATNVASPITMCTTSGLNGACTEPTITLVPGFADTAYTVTCSCTGTNAGVPELVSIVKASNSLVVGIVSAGATPSASCAEIDCTAIHD
jgi:hypothetical protein